MQLVIPVIGYDNMINSSHLEVTRKVNVRHAFKQGEFKKEADGCLLLIRN
ncbi:hypothetical protein STRCR_1187 [Streptococcus criceti HS-6]|uniref:Uncharacterized protein n=1 Tax=Streptococcus criceti HS-6 TaxID=873449 RepID=G5JTT7_STRCG|nr:hypothetical protein STRCR_1187 [Streptococcus criceti HS-6]